MTNQNSNLINLNWVESLSYVIDSNFAYFIAIVNGKTRDVEMSNEQIKLTLFSKMWEVRYNCPIFHKLTLYDPSGNLYTSFNERYISEVFLGGGVPQNFGRVCCSMGPRKLMFYCFFKWQFLGCVVLWDQIFVAKSVKN